MRTIFKFLSVFFLAFLTSLVINFLVLAALASFTIFLSTEPILVAVFIFSFLISPFILHFIFLKYSKKTGLIIYRTRMSMIVLELIYLPFFYLTLLMLTNILKIKPMISFGLNYVSLLHMLLFYFSLAIPLCIVSYYRKK